MHLLGNEEELVVRLAKAGYRPEYAEAMSEDLKGITSGSILGLAEVETAKFWVEIAYDVRPGNHIEITSTAASLNGKSEWRGSSRLRLTDLAVNVGQFLVDLYDVRIGIAAGQRRIMCGRCIVRIGFKAEFLQ